MKHLLNIFLLIASMIVFASCKPSVPSEYISPGDMEDILYDYHVMAAVAEQKGDSTGQLAFAYRAGVLKKHGVTEKEFDASMAYYMRHADRMEKIYSNLSERLDKENVALGGNSTADNISFSGDTANVWNQETAMVLSATEPFNERDFSIKVDSAFHKGDQLSLDFDAQFIFQDGMRDGIAVLAVTFANDSVTQQVIHVSNTQHYRVAVSDNDSLGIKAVEGFLYLNNPNSAEGGTTTLKLMILQNIRLIKMHASKTDAQQKSGGVPTAEQPVNRQTGQPGNSQIGQTGNSQTGQPGNHQPMNNQPAQPANSASGVPASSHPVRQNGQQPNGTVTRQPLRPMNSQPNGRPSLPKRMPATKANVQMMERSIK